MDDALAGREQTLEAAWLEALGTSDRAVLRRRLAWDGAGAGTGRIERLLHGPESDDAERFQEIQDWLRASSPIDASAPLADEPPAAFAELWRRIAARALDELVGTLPEEVSANQPAVLRDLGDYLVSRLATVGEGALWQAFNTRRTPSAVAMAHARALVAGEQRPARTLYCAFLEALRSDRLQALTRTYPVLQRHLSTAVGQWLRCSAELLMRVHRDSALLQDAFGLPSDATVVGVRQGLSDPHRGGRTVAMLTFAPASSPADTHTIVYKPKDLRLDRAFQSLVASLGLRSITVLPRDGYGYMERVPHNVCVTDEQLRAFYRKAGRLTALLHLLGSTDCHHENLIACETDLVLVDAETLFEGARSDGTTASEAADPSLDLSHRIESSVLRLGLLPQWEFIGTQPTPRDISALGIDPPGGPRRKAVGWIDRNTDGMRAGEIEEPAYLPLSLPVGTGSPNRFRDFVDEFCEGFEGQLLAIANSRAQWIAEDGPLSRFRLLRRRHVPRPTWLYGWLLDRQLAPSALRSEVSQRLTLETLARSYLIASERPRGWPVFRSEVRQMERLDVPYFDEVIGDRDLVRARDKIRRLNPAAIDFEVRLIRGVIDAKSRRPAHAVAGAPVRTGEEPPDDVSDEDRAAEARALGRLLVDSSIADGSGAIEWLGVDVAVDGERSRYGALGPSLYSGRAGIALFLAALARSGHAERDAYRRTAVAASADLLRLGGEDERRRWWRDQPLGLNGSGGALMTLLRLGRLLPDLREAVAEKVSSLLDGLTADHLRADRQLDVMGGSAGLIGPLLEVGTPTAMTLAEAAGDTLVAQQDPGGGWVIDALGTRPLTGFSHGASGMASALARLDAAVPREAYGEAARRALRYEHETFDPIRRNWPDLRGGHASPTHRFLLGWCHGAPGVALSRLCFFGTSLWDARTETELEHALRSTADTRYAGDSVCCGRFGRAAILRLAARLCDEPDWLSAAARLERLALTDRRGGGYSFGEALGLFNGAAGVGLALLDATADDDHQVLPAILSAGLCDRQFAEVPLKSG